MIWRSTGLIFCCHTSKIKEILRIDILNLIGVDSLYFYWRVYSHIVQKHDGIPKMCLIAILLSLFTTMKNWSRPEFQLFCELVTMQKTIKNFIEISSINFIWKKSLKTSIGLCWEYQIGLSHLKNMLKHLLGVKKFWKMLAVLYTQKIHRFTNLISLTSSLTKNPPKQSYQLAVEHIQTSQENQQ